MSNKPTIVASVRIKVTDLATVVSFFNSQEIEISTKGKAISEVFKIFAESLPEFKVDTYSEAVEILTNLRCESGLEKSNRLSNRLRKYLNIEQQSEHEQLKLTQIAEQIMKTPTDEAKEDESSFCSLTSDEEEFMPANITSLAKNEKRINADLTHVPGDEVDFRNALMDNTPKVKD